METRLTAPKQKVQFNKYIVHDFLFTVQYLLIELSGPGEDLVQKDVQCGDCYGATPPHGGECCNTCDDVRKAYADMGWIVKEDEIEQ